MHIFEEYYTKKSYSLKKLSPNIIQSTMKQSLLFFFLISITLNLAPAQAQDQTEPDDIFIAGQGVTDRDGNQYYTVVVGDQEWMTQNLSTSHYANGDSIPHVTDRSDWAALATGSWTYYNNDDYFVTHYGKLYNWHAVNDSRGLCPSGWRVPSDDDWKNLEQQVGMSESQLRRAGARGSDDQIGGKLKSTDMQHWREPNQSATNESGFAGLPGGNRSEAGGFEGIGYLGIWWSSTEAGSGMAWMRMLSHDNDNITKLYSDKRYGFSVRCFRNIDDDDPDRIAIDPDADPAVAHPRLTTTPVTGVTVTSAVAGGNIIDEGDDPVTHRGVVWATTSEPRLESNDGIELAGSGPGEFQSTIEPLRPETTYYVRTFAATDRGVSYGNPVSFTTPPETDAQTISDVDGNVYRTVQIGNQVWMAENLRTSRYRNGDEIMNVPDNNDWQNLGQQPTGAWVYYNNLPDNMVYGKLYNWYTVNDRRGLCPSGWRVATDNDWQQLERYLGMAASEAGSSGWRGADANVGGKLKDAGTSYWRGPNVGASNESGFSARAGGYRFTSGSFSYLSFFGYWWTASEFDANNAWRRLLFNSRESVNRMNYDKRYGFSVRCVEN